MSRYTVAWTQSAQDKLLELWLRASDRDSVRYSADRAEEMLAYDPALLGTDTEDGYRTLRMQPLTFKFDVREDDRVAEVLDVMYVEFE